MKTCGIYIIKNKINNLVYIGQSVQCESRWYSHKSSAKNIHALDHNTKIHLAMYNLGISNFYYEILEKCEYDKLDEREIYWIHQYNSYEKGYNSTPGGGSNIGEANGRALLTENEVREIRLAYGNHISFKEVYKKYQHIISKRGLQKVWRFETWRHILPEVYTDENRRWHSTQAKSHADGNVSLGINNKQRACSEEEIQKMRELRLKGLSYNKIGQLLNRSQSVVRKYCLFQESKKPNGGKSIKNTETGLVFSSETEASKWAKCDRHTINKNKNTIKSAGIVPSTNQPAHWISL